MKLKQQVCAIPRLDIEVPPVNSFGTLIFAHKGFKIEDLAIDSCLCCHFAGSTTKATVTIILHQLRDNFTVDANRPHRVQLLVRS